VLGDEARHGPGTADVLDPRLWRERLNIIIGMPSHEASAG
jgi:hypothetical protein